MKPTAPGTIEIMTSRRHVELGPHKRMGSSNQWFHGKQIPGNVDPLVPWT